MTAEKVFGFPFDLNVAIEIHQMAKFSFSNKLRTILHTKPKKGEKKLCAYAVCTHKQTRPLFYIALVTGH